MTTSERSPWAMAAPTTADSISFKNSSQHSVHFSMREREREREMFYLTTHSTHFIYGYMASDIWLRTILIVRKETRCRPISYSYRLTARVLLYALYHRQDNTYHGLCYTSRGTRNSSMGFSMPSPHCKENLDSFEKRTVFQRRRIQRVCTHAQLRRFWRWRCVKTHPT